MTKGFVCSGKTFYFHNLHEKSHNFLVTLTQLSLDTVFILFYLKKPFNLDLRMNIPLLYSENYFNSSFLVMVRTYHAFHERDKMDLSYLPKVKKIFQMQTPFSVLF